MTVPLRSDFDAARVRLAARESSDGDQVRLPLALAAVCDGSTRSQAAEIGGVTLQIIRTPGSQVQRAWTRWPDRSQGAGPGIFRAPRIIPLPARPQSRFNQRSLIRRSPDDAARFF